MTRGEDDWFWFLWQYSTWKSSNTNKHMVAVFYRTISLSTNSNKIYLWSNFNSNLSIIQKVIHVYTFYICSLLYLFYLNTQFELHVISFETKSIKEYGKLFKIYRHLLSWGSTCWSLKFLLTHELLLLHTTQFSWLGWNLIYVASLSYQIISITILISQWYNPKHPHKFPWSPFLPFTPS